MMREILARSYKDLPSHHLRSCFLYLASFPEDYVIDVSDLIELWIAESFIPHTRSHKLEETARNYVSELAQRSLVQVVDRSKVHGWIEKIRVHDILSDWCIEKAREDGFLDVIDKTTGQKGASSSDTTRVYRYSYQNLRSDSLEAAPCWVRTVVCFGLTSVSIPKLRFLRVLHIQNSRLENLPSAIGGCIHVRCLRLRNCESVTLPSSIGQLLYLQTLDLRGTLLDSEVARSIWDITTLRHVFLQNGFRPPALARSKRQQRQTELQTLVLGLPFVATKKTYADMVIFLGQMNQLTTLNLPMRNIPGGMINIVEKMPDLVDAYISRFGMLDKLPAKFPESLQRLVLEADNLTQDPMPTLEKLPCLVVLELTGHTGETISCSNKGFPRLQKLKLGDFRGEWNMAVGAMPKLSHLLLSKYSNLDGLPQALLHIRYLSYIRLTSMPWITEHNDSTLKKLLLKGCEVKRDDFLVI
uniref:Uncharacterized protein n=1 Tax=Avena sativa TaxID=4498 RepID=A0ACD5V928_AVESA